MTVSVRLCIDCGSRDSAAGNRRCYSCLHKRRKARDGYSGIPCVSCGATMSGGYTPKRGSKLCHSCRAERRERWGREGRPCEDCGRTTGVSLKARCGRCQRLRQTKTCAVYQCEGLVQAKGLCATHYAYEWRRENDVSVGWGTWITPVRRLSIYRRDKWTCQLCSDPIDREVGPNADLAPSLDHVLPRSLGGGHESSNLRLAHRVCNAARGANVSV